VTVLEGVTMVQATDDDAPTDNVRPFPGATPEPQPRLRRRLKARTGAKRSKDPTGAERSKRYRQNKRTRSVTDGDQPTDKNKQDEALVSGVTVDISEDKTTEGKAKNDVDSVTVEQAPRHGAAVDLAAYTAAVALAGAAAWFSIRGMVVLFPGSPVPVVVMAIAMEAAKLITAGWLARRWSSTAAVWRLALILFVAGLAVINATGVFAQLVSAHVGDRGAAASHLEAQTADIEAKIDVQAHKVADLDRRLGQIDATIEEAAKRGRAKTALEAIEGQRKFREALVDERNREAGTLAALKAERASAAARGRQIETEAAPIRYVAELLGVDTDSERAIRWLIALMVLCCDPLAIALTAAASARR
jgi:hypothetical protein